MALEGIRRDPPDVALVDMGLPGPSGIHDVLLLKEDRPGLLVLVLTLYDDEERIFEALCAGASGYLLKKTPPTKLLESISEVVKGDAPMSPEVDRRVIDLCHHLRPPD